MLNSRAPTADIDVYRSAKFLIDQHGQDAILQAAIRADELRDAGDPRESVAEGRRPAVEVQPRMWRMPSRHLRRRPSPPRRRGPIRGRDGEDDMVGFR